MAKQREFTKGTDLPASGSKSASGKSTNYGGYTFIEGYLNEQDRQWLEDNLDSQEEYIFRLVCELPIGYKLSLSFEGKSERFLATLTCLDDTSSDHKKILTSRGATRIDALYGLYYRHYIKLADGWGVGGGNNHSRWD